MSSERQLRLLLDLSSTLVRCWLQSIPDLEGSNELLVLKLSDINCSVMFVATAFPIQPEPAPAGTCDLSGQHLVAFGQCLLGLCSFGALQNTWKRVILQSKALVSRKGPVLLEGLGTSLFVHGCVCLVQCTRSPTVSHRCHLLPTGSLCLLPLSSASLRHSRCLGMLVFIGGFCCPVSFSDCHLTCAPGNTPSGSGLGFWGSGSPPQ